MVTVSKEITRLEHSAVKLTLTVAKDEVRSSYDSLLEEYAKVIQIPGFRKGKAPRPILERKLGEALQTDALARIVERAMTTVLEDKDELPADARPLPYSTPKIEDMPSLDLDVDMVFSVTYDTFPAIHLGPWKGLEIEVPQVVIEDDDINRELAFIQERNATVQDKDDDAPAEQNDVVTVTYAELTPEGTTAPGTERQDFVFTLGTGHNIYKIDDDILGMKKGESKDFEKSYPETFEDADLAGKTKKLRVSLTALKKKELPALDDEFAQDVDEKYKTLEDLKNSLRERLSRDVEERLQAVKINTLLEKIMEHTPVDLPESMIQLQLDRNWQNLAQRLNTPVEALKESVETAESPLTGIVQNWRPETIKLLHSRLVMEEIMKDLHIVVTDEDVKAQVKTLAGNSGTPLEEMERYYQQGEARQYLEDEVKEARAYKQLLAENIIKPGNTMKYREFAENK